MAVPLVVAVQVTPVKELLISSLTSAAVAVLGPSLVTVIVQVTVSPAVYVDAADVLSITRSASSGVTVI